MIPFDKGKVGHRAGIRLPDVDHKQLMCVVDQFEVCEGLENLPRAVSGDMENTVKTSKPLSPRGSAVGS